MSNEYIGSKYKVHYHMVCYFVDTPYILYFQSRGMAMSDEDWQAILTKVEDWKTANPDWEEKYGQEDLWSLDRYLQRGTENANRRNPIKTMLREMFFDIADTPFSSSKVGAGLTAPMVSARDSIIADASKALAEAFDNTPALRAIMVKNGKSGGGFFSNGAEFSNYTLSLSAKNLLNRMFKGTDKYGRKWSGTYSTEDVEWLPTQEAPKTKAKKAKKE